MDDSPGAVAREKKDEMPGSKKELDKTLLEDVRKFASELGFASASGGTGSESAFQDFAPAKANKKINGSIEKQKKKKNKKEDVLSDREGRREKREGGKKYEINKKRPSGKGEYADTKNTIKTMSIQTKNRKGVSDRQKSLFGIDDQGFWWEIMPALASDRSLNAVDGQEASELREKAKMLLENEARVAHSEAKETKYSGVSWLEQAKQGGTTSDKVAAMAVLVQESPLAHLSSLEGLLAMARKRGGARAVVGNSLDVLSELWKDVLLPHDRKLRFFEQQPLALLPKGKQGDKYLVLWEFEDQLKSKYASFIESLSDLTKDNLEFIKEKSLKTSFDLLLTRPEQEAQLLRIIINKLGDPERKLASNAGYLITKLLSHHEGMKHVVVREVENFIYRPGLSDRARYYAVVYLNQIVLSKKDQPMKLADGTFSSLAKRLVNVYFTLFKLIIDGALGTAAAIAKAATEKKEEKRNLRARKRGKKRSRRGSSENEKEIIGERDGELDSRMLSALITGIRRAFPFVTTDEIEPLINEHSDSLFKLIHTASFGVATQSLLLLFQLMSSQTSISDRFYRALYAVMSSSELPRSTKASLFLSLVLKAMKADVSTKRVLAFLKRLLQVALSAPANFACGCLIIVSEILKLSPGYWNAVNDSEETFEDEMATKEAYLPEKRDPLYCNAEKSCLWELAALSKHYHPSVAAMTKTLLAGVNVQYAGDPLKDFTSTEFLDKFIAKKPKARSKTGDSLMQPIRDDKQEPNPLLSSHENTEVAPDEAFFHRFFEIKTQRGQKKKKTAKHDDGIESDESSLAEDDFLAGAEGDLDDATFGDEEGDYDYSKLTQAMETTGSLSGSEEEEEYHQESDSPGDSESQESLEGQDFSDDDDVGDSGDDIDEDGDSELLEGRDDEEENVFGSYEEYEDMIQDRMANISSK